VKGKVEQGGRAGGTGKVRQIYMGHRGGTWWHGGTGGTGKVGRADFGRACGSEQAGQVRNGRRNNVVRQRWRERLSCDRAGGADIGQKLLLVGTIRVLLSEAET